MVSKSSYIGVIEDYLTERTDYNTFWKKYNDLYVNEDTLDEDLFSILETIWGNAEVTTLDSTLLADYPDQYLSEAEFRKLVQRDLLLLQSSSSTTGPANSQS